MKKLKVYFDKDNLKILLGNLSILGLCAVGLTSYVSYEDKTQIIEEEIELDDFDTFLDEEGQIFYNFLPGEHKVQVSNNYFVHYETDNIEGYIIESVNIDTLRHHSEVIYVNTEPVTVRGTENKDGTIDFNDFGEVTRYSYKKIK